MAMNYNGPLAANQWAQQLVQFFESYQPIDMKNTGGTVVPRLLPQVAESLLRGYNAGGQVSPYQGLKKGAFTADAKSRGMTPAQFQAKVLSNPSEYSEVIRKRAQWRKNFAG